MKVNGYEIEPRANLSHADLSGADLRGADLRSADLQGADLRSADLQGAKRGHYTIKSFTAAVMTSKYYIVIFDSHMEIGCESHTAEEWFSFDDECIDNMDFGALEWWRMWKKPLQEICKAV